MSEQSILDFVADFNCMSLEARWLLRGIQLGMMLAGDVSQSNKEELIRCGLYEAPDPSTNTGHHGPH